jgi:hypothetical protein
MGDEATATLRLAEGSYAGKAYLETTELIFRGDRRFVLPLKEIEAVSSEAGRLIVTHHGERAEFEIGPAAGRWAEKIRNPRGRLDKLGVKPGMRVAVLGIDDPDFVSELTARGSEISGDGADGLDLVFYSADSIEELERLAELRGRLKPAGAVWVVSRKGKAATLKDVEVMAAARGAGLVDNKVVAFSETHTALRLVIPRAQR